MRAEGIVERAGRENLLERGTGVLEYGRRLGITLLVGIARLVQGHHVDLFGIAGAGEGVPDEGEIIPHGRRQAVEADFVNLSDGLRGTCRRSGVPDLRCRGDNGKEEICRAFQKHNWSRERLLTHHL